jgi:ribosome-associated toxin RatA of RatAB toxin-antitoxin module
MYELVVDVSQYGDFLPWCGGARFLEVDGDRVTAQVDIDFKGVRKSFTTENTLQQDRMISMRLKEGPFSRLHGDWQFTDLKGAGSKITLDMHFDFSNRLLAAVIGPVFSTIANTLVDSFYKRAREIYGSRDM